MTAVRTVRYFTIIWASRIYQGGDREGGVVRTSRAAGASRQLRPLPTRQLEAL